MTCIDLDSDAAARLERLATAVSARKVRANRRNAKRSTGPRTERGKRAAARNAITHGLFCRELVLPGEDDAAFVRFRAAMLADLRPRSAVEFVLCDRVVALAWRLRRVTAAEAAEHEAHADAHLRDHLDRCGWRVYDGPPLGDARWEQIKASAAARGDMPAAPLDAGAVLARSLREPDGGSFERLNRYEHRLQSMLHRAMRELQQLRRAARQAEDEAEGEGEADLASATLAAPYEAPVAPATEPREAPGAAGDPRAQDEDERVARRGAAALAGASHSSAPSARLAPSAPASPPRGARGAHPNVQNEPTVATAPAIVGGGEACAVRGRRIAVGDGGAARGVASPGVRVALVADDAEKKEGASA